MFDKNNLRYIDFWLLFLVSILVFIGVVMIGSAHGWHLEKDHFYLDSMMKKQLFGYFLGLVAAFFLLVVNYEAIKIMILPFYGAIILALIAVLIIGVGSEADGDDVRRWIQLPLGFTLQPSEFAKTALILLLAWYINLYQDKINHIGILLLLGIMVVIPLYLIYKEPDLSTSVVFVAIIFFMLFNGKLSWWYVIPVIALGAVLAYVIYTDAMSETPHILNSYQVLRIRAWQHPEDYVLKEAYQTIQSTNAVGSGGLLGVGLFQGSGTVPVATTDFIFGIIGEELGFVGSIAIIVVFLLIFVRILFIAGKARDLFGRLICIGVAVSMIFQTSIHIGVCTGVLPNTGIPLPFVSYGLSSLVSSMLGIGLVLKVKSESALAR